MRAGRRVFVLVLSQCLRRHSPHRASDAERGQGDSGTVGQVKLAGTSETQRDKGNTVGQGKLTGITKLSGTRTRETVGQGKHSGTRETRWDKVTHWDKGNSVGQGQGKHSGTRETRWDKGNSVGQGKPNKSFNLFLCLGLTDL